MLQYFQLPAVPAATKTEGPSEWAISRSNSGHWRPAKQAEAAKRIHSATAKAMSVAHNELEQEKAGIAGSAQAHIARTIGDVLWQHCQLLQEDLML